MPVSNVNPGFWTSLRRHLNFFRIHLLFFTFAPLICSVVLYASNGRYPIAYIDALYMSVSAVTVCGLSTINLSQLTAWQQALLFIQMCVGSPVLVSWFMVYIRRLFFARKFKYIIEAEAARRAASKPVTQQSPESAMASTTGRRTHGWGVASLFRRRNGSGPSGLTEELPSASEHGSLTPRERERRRKFTTDMVRRIDAPPKRVDPSGWVSEGLAAPLRRSSNSSGGPQKAHHTEQTLSSGQIEPLAGLTSGPIANDAQTPLDRAAARESIELRLSDSTMPQGPPQSSSVGMHRTTTIEFAPPVTRHYVPLSTVPGRHSGSARDPSVDERLRRQVSRDTRYSTQRTSLSNIDQSGLGQAQASQADFGGFPMPHKLVGMLFQNLFPGTANRLRKTMTVPAKTALAGGELGRTASITGAVRNIPTGTKPVSYISFDTTVVRNSSFQMLTNEQLEELGGVEYRGLNALLWLVALYHFGSQLVSFVVIAPYMSLPKWAHDFVPPASIRPVAASWFSLFQVVSAYTNTGFSLVDQSMIPFQTAYPMIFLMIFLIVAGNTGFPIFLRFMIWAIAKLTPTESRLYETLHFLLDHPRRCFVYLFPAHQTWLLLSILVLLNSIDFFCFMVLNIGIPIIDSIPFGTRFAVGLLQATDVRAAGFNIVPVAAMAPAVKVLYVIMMYINVYPIAMSVRSTNVYEERSLGIFHMDDQLSAAEQVFTTNGSRMATWGRYLAMHARYQLSFDMWWLALAIFLICIIERDNLIDPMIQGWFNIFTIIFEIVSAYGSVGLSLGIPTENYSLSGAFRPLSKLVVCLVMIRGRHRGLPVAIDRAIVLPYEFERAQDSPDLATGTDERSSRCSDMSHPIEGSVDDVEHAGDRGQRVGQR